MVSTQYIGDDIILCVSWLLGKKIKYHLFFFLPSKKFTSFFVLLLTSDMVFLSVVSPLQFKIVARLNFQFQDAFSNGELSLSILAQSPNTTCETSSGCFEGLQECQFVKQRLTLQLTPKKPYGWSKYVATSAIFLEFDHPCLSWIQSDIGIVRICF